MRLADRPPPDTSYRCAHDVPPSPRRRGRDEDPRYFCAPLPSLRAERSNPRLGIARSKMDCFASLAMTAVLIAHTSAISRREAPERCMNLSPQNNMRAQGMPGARRGRSLACKIKKHTSIVTTVTPGSPGIPRTMVLTVSFALFPVTGLYCHRHWRNYFRQLDASVGASEPHDFAVRLTCCSSAAPSASTASRPAFVTIASRPSLGRDSAVYSFDLGEAGTEMFLQMGLDSPNHIESFQQMRLRAHPKTLQISVSMRSLFSRWRDNR